MINIRNIAFCVIFALLFTSAGIIVRREYSAETMLNSCTFYKDNVIIDAGHGGEDGGAVGIDGTLEKDVNLSISEKIYDLLGLYGINVYMTRSDDVSLHSENAKKINKRKLSDMQNRVKQVTETPNAVLISIHQNYFPEENCRGAQVFFGKNNVQSRPLAESVLISLNKGLNDRYIRDIKKVEDRVYLLKNVNCPAILVECGFLSNAKESELLMSDSYRLKISACIASGYLQYTKDEVMEDAL